MKRKIVHMYGEPDREETYEEAKYRTQLRGSVCNLGRVPQSIKDELWLSARYNDTPYEEESVQTKCCYCQYTGGDIQDPEAPTQCNFYDECVPNDYRYYTPFKHD